MKVNNPIIKRKKELLKQNKIIVFIEKIVRYTENKENLTYVLFDFPAYNSNINIFFELIQLDFIEGKSMLEIKNIRFDKAGIIPREGHYYNLPDNLIENFNWIPFNQNNSELSNYIALSSDGIKEEIKFEKSVDYKNFAEELVDNKKLPQALETFKKIDSSQIEVDIYDVGQGNWNEICFNDSFLISYDLGASSSSAFLKSFNNVITKQTRNLKINTLLNPNFNFKKILIISHWDIDHYNGIFEINDNIVKSYDFCLVPNKVENDTTKRALDKLLKNTEVFPIEMSNKGRGRGATSVLTTIYDTNLLKIYKGTKCSDRNKRGLLLSLHAKQVDFIFTGDHHYYQIDKYVIPNCNYDELNIVIPHHGGHAGNYNLMYRWINCNDSIISSGNKHGHPFPHIVDVCEDNFTNVYRTDLPFDYNKNF